MHHISDPRQQHRRSAVSCTWQNFCDSRRPFHHLQPFSVSPPLTALWVVRSDSDFQACRFNRLSNIRYAWTSYHIHLINTFHFISFYILIHHNQLRSPISDSARGVHLRYFCLAHSVISSSLPLNLNIGLSVIRGWSPFILMGLFQFTQKNFLYIYKWAWRKDSVVGPLSFCFFFLFSFLTL